MTIEFFRHEIKEINGFYVVPDVILFTDPLELWNERTDKSVRFKTLDEVLAYEINGKMIHDYVLDMETLNIPDFTGGRGASSGQQKTFKFGHGETKMTNGRGFMKVKEWFFDKTNEAAASYGIVLVGEYIDGRLDHTTFRVEEILAETEKAVKVKLDAETRGGRYKAWETWVPKSVITAM